MTARTWQNRIVGTDEVAPDQLVANPKNWRTHPGNQRDALRGSLDQVGWVQQVMVNQRTGHVVDGHARVEEALSRGEATVPVLYVDLDEAEEALVLATLDPIGAMATVDGEKLRMLLAEVEFDSEEMRRYLEDLAPDWEAGKGLTDPDDVPEPPKETSIKRGDIFALGDHRLMCGDSTAGGDVGLLMAGTAVALLLTDPPYGLDRNLARAKGRAWRIENDNPTDAPDMYGALASIDAPERYVWGQWNTWANLVGALGMPDNCIVWVKSNMGMGHGYRHQHEFLAYYGSRSFSGQSDVWESPRDYSGLHPTIKPVGLLTRAIDNSSAKGEAVADLFVGSGSTIIAAEQTGRRCYGMEIDPRYVAVAIERWEKFTGRKATPVHDVEQDEDPFEAWVESH